MNAGFLQNRFEWILGDHAEELKDLPELRARLERLRKQIMAYTLSEGQSYEVETHE